MFMSLLTLGVFTNQKVPNQGKQMHLSERKHAMFQCRSNAESNFTHGNDSLNVSDSFSLIFGSGTKLHRHGLPINSLVCCCCHSQLLRMANASTAPQTLTALPRMGFLQFAQKASQPPQPASFTKKPSLFSCLKTWWTPDPG